MQPQGWWRGSSSNNGSLLGAVALANQIYDTNCVSCHAGRIGRAIDDYPPRRRVR